MKAFLKRLGILALIGYVFLLILFFFIQRNFLYYPDKPYQGPETTSLTEVNTVQIETSAGEVLPAWWHAPEDGEAVVIFFHGNASSAHNGRFIYQHLMNEGFGILGAEYPGYPGASGKPTQDSLTRAAIAHFDFLIKQGIAPGDIYVIGNSLGTGVAAQLAVQRPVGKIVLMAPFNSIQDMFAIKSPVPGMALVTRDKFESDKALAGQNIPMLWVHGTNDQVVPISQGRKLYESYNGPKQSFIIHTGRHSDLWVLGGRERITEFLGSESKN